MEFRFGRIISDFGRITRFGMYALDERGKKEYGVTIENGLIKVVPISESEDVPTMFTLSTSFINDYKFLQAMADGLAEMGIHQKIDESARQASEAKVLLLERELEYYKKIVSAIADKVVGNI